MAIDLSLEENWVEIFNQEVELEERATKQNRIPIFLISAIYNEPYFKIYADNKNAEPFWWMAGTIYLAIGSIANETPAIAASYRVPLGQWTLIKFEPLAQAWHLQFEPNYWHQQISLTVEQYQSLT